MVMLAERVTAQRGRGRHEVVRLEPRGRRGRRVRGLLWQAISDDLPGALRDLSLTSADVHPSGAAGQPFPSSPEGSQVFRLAGLLGRQHIPVPDRRRDAVGPAFTRSILVSTCRPNSLRYSAGSSVSR
jgi:hypothetical protein